MDLSGAMLDSASLIHCGAGSCMWACLTCLILCCHAGEPGHGLALGIVNDAPHNVRVSADGCIYLISNTHLLIMQCSTSIPLIPNTNNFRPRVFVEDEGILFSAPESIWLPGFSWHHTAIHIHTAPCHPCSSGCPCLVHLIICSPCAGTPHHCQSFATLTSLWLPKAKKVELQLASQNFHHQRFPHTRFLES